MPQASNATAPSGDTGVRAIVGLGNSGDRYQKNRHNAGFWFVDLVAEAYNTSLSPNKNLGGDMGRIEVQGLTVYLFRPKGFVNNSGGPVSALQRFFKLETGALLVAHDEIDFPVARVRVKYGGGHGGHNGLRDIIRLLGGTFWRLRIGVGRPDHPAMEVSDYVLGNPTPPDQDAIMTALRKVVTGVPQIVRGEASLLMNNLHHES